MLKLHNRISFVLKLVVALLVLATSWKVSHLLGGGMLAVFLLDQVNEFLIDYHYAKNAKQAMSELVTEYAKGLGGGNC